MEGICWIQGYYRQHDEASPKKSTICMVTIHNEHFFEWWIQGRMMLVEWGQDLPIHLWQGDILSPLLSNGFSYSFVDFSTGMRNEIFKWRCRLYVWVGQGEVNHKFKFLKHVSFFPLLIGILPHPQEEFWLACCLAFEMTWCRREQLPFLAPHLDCPSALSGALVGQI